MKTQEEIEQLAENSSYNNSEHFEDYQDGMFYGKFYQSLNKQDNEN